MYYTTISGKTNVYYIRTNIKLNYISKITSEKQIAINQPQ